MPQTSSAAVAAPDPVTAASAEPAPVQPSDACWRQAMRLPCSVSIEVPLPGFRVKDLLGMRATSLVGSHWPTSDNLPLKVNGELIAWCEFEVLGNRLAVRLTELA